MTRNAGRPVSGAAGLHVEHGDDVGVSDGREREGLPLEARLELGVAARLGGEHLDRHVATEPKVARTVHGRHAAGTDRGLDPVAAAQDLAGHDRGHCARG